MNARWIYLSLLIIAMPLRAGWVITQPPPLPQVACIVYSAQLSQGHASFDAALKELSDRGLIQQLDGISGYELLADDTLQQELLAGLQRDAPRELKEAKKSSGNMHNPKLHQLWKPFEKVFLATPTVTKLNASLSTYGLAITRVSIEKFEFIITPPDTARRFRGGLWLTITKSPNNAIHRTPTRWHAECLVAALPALVAPAVRCR